MKFIRKSSATRNKSLFPRYYCSGNGYDTWEIDILQGHRRTESLAKFRVVKSGDNLSIERNVINKPNKTFPVTSLKNTDKMSVSEEVMFRTAYCEAQVLAIEYTRKIQEKYTSETR
jgi:hypothetical protein